MAHFVIDGGIFMRAVQLIPPDIPVMKDDRYIKDRIDFVGSGSNPFTREVLLAGRPEAASELRDVVELLETTLLLDGRDWVLKTDGPTLADIEAVWILDWIINMSGAVPAEMVSADKFPNVWAWMDRFSRAVEVRKKQAGEPKTFTGDEATVLIAKSPFAEPKRAAVDADDLVVAAHQLREGDAVQLWPTDTGSLHKDAGKLVSMTSKEIVIETQGRHGGVRVHASRHGFRVRKQRDEASQL